MFNVATEADGQVETDAPGDGLGGVQAVPRNPWRIQKSVVFALFIRELKSRFGAYKGGYVWLLVEPMAHVLLLGLIFSALRHRGSSGIDTPVLIVTGVVPFLMFKNIALQVMEGVDANRALFTFRQIKPTDVFVARTLLDGFLSLAVFAILLVGMAWLGMATPFRDPLAVLFILGLLIAAALGLGMIFCVVVRYMPESKTFIRLSFMPLYLLSGIVFPLAAVPQAYLSWLMWNPLVHAIEALRDGFFLHYPLIPGVSPGFAAMTGIGLLLVGLAWYRTQRYELLAQ